MPARRPPAAARERILAAATRCFAARGFEGTSLQDVADAVGLRKPSLLYHFESKQALHQAVLEQLLSRWSEVLPRLLLAATSGEGRFDAVAGEMIAFFTADPDRARLLLREALDRPRELGRLVAGHVPPWAAMVCRYIRKGQAEGLLHGDVDPEAYVVQVINLVVAGVATWSCIGTFAAGLDGSRGARELPARHLRELARVARASLFLPPTSPPPPSPRAVRGRGKRAATDRSVDRPRPQNAKR